MVSASVFRSDEWYLRNTLTIRPQPEANRLRKHLQVVENYMYLAMAIIAHEVRAEDEIEGGLRLSDRLGVAPVQLP